jgi:dCMP deaminase
MTEYRKNRLSWSDLRMLQAVLIAQRSPDPNTCVGAIVVKDNKMISEGYNGAPRGIHPCQMPWEREGEYEDTKYAWVTHAELNAILNARQNLKETSIFCTLFPCPECLKAIINAGITEVFYLDDKYIETNAGKVSTKMAELVDLKIKKYKWESIEAENISNFIVGDNKK